MEIKGGLTLEGLRVHCGVHEASRAHPHQVPDGMVHHVVVLVEEAVVLQQLGVGLVPQRLHLRAPGGLELLVQGPPQPPQLEHPVDVVVALDADLLGHSGLPGVDPGVES